MTLTAITPLARAGRRAKLVAAFLATCLAVGFGTFALAPGASAGSNGAIGYVDSVSNSGNVVQVAGWTLWDTIPSQDIYYRVKVSYGADSYSVYGRTTNRRNDVNAAFGTTGSHGFNRSVTIPAAWRTVYVCAYGTDQWNYLYLQQLKNCRWYSLR